MVKKYNLNKIPSREGGTARNLFFLVFLKVNIDKWLEQKQLHE